MWGEILISPSWLNLGVTMDKEQAITLVEYNTWANHPKTWISSSSWLK